MDNFNFGVFDYMTEAVVKLKDTHIVYFYKKASGFGFEEKNDILNIFTCNEIDEIARNIINKKDFNFTTNIYFFKSVARFCNIIYDSKDSYIILYDKTESELLKKVKSDFITSLSHEIRTPLSVAKGNIQILKDFSVDEKNYEYIKKTDKSLNKIEKIINQLTTLSMAEFGNYMLKIDIIDTKAIVDEVRQDLENKIKVKNIDIITEYKTDTLKGDKFIIYTIIRNLISNAVKYSYENNSVFVEITDEYIHVKDDGIGIRDEEKERIFERFFRGIDSAKFAKGSGLGLSIVKYLCELSGYKIKLKSKWMVGTEFYIYFK